MRIALTKHTTILLFFFSVIVLFSAVSIAATNAVFLFTDRIYEGVTVGTISVGGLSVDEANIEISNTFKEQMAQSSITVTYQHETWTITPQDIEITINPEDLAMQAHNIGRTGNPFKIIQERYLAVHGGYNIPLTKNYNQDYLYEILNTIAKSVNRNPQNASLVYKNDAIFIIPETWGQKVNMPQSFTDIADQLHNSILFSSELTVNSERPTIMSQDFTDIDSLIGEYTTQFDSNDIKRYENVAIASKHINNILVHSGEVFSFNQSVGLRIPEYGYNEAPVMVDGKLLLDWGGGVCQVSSTLYNAALLADMEITERISHYRPPGYVPLGQDATVADNLIDFKFRNSTPYNIYITSEIINNQITVSIFGQRIANYVDIRIESTTKKLAYNTVIKQDSTLALGTKVIKSTGQQGFEVATYRIKLINGHEISREALSSDLFKPEDRIIHVGTKLQSQHSTK
ncbi:MAG: VanW family protein [Sporomusaceae bacterium]|nr:VanW family protein [Sporomusaceae bacterium]